MGTRESNQGHAIAHLTATTDQKHYALAMTVHIRFSAGVKPSLSAFAVRSNTLMGREA